MWKVTSQILAWSLFIFCEENISAMLQTYLFFYWLILKYTVYTHCMTHTLHPASLRLCCSVAFANPEPAEASWLGGRQQRPSVVCVFSLVPCHKTPLPEHPREPACTKLRLGTDSPKHLYSPLAPLRDSCVLPKPRHNNSSIWKGPFAAAGRLHNRAINLNWRSSAEHRKTFNAVRQWSRSPELHKIETDARLS